MDGQRGKKKNEKGIPFNTSYSGREIKKYLNEMCMV
jgi:hypothetical protein